MYGYGEYYDENIYEPTPLDELFTEYREKCKTILLSSIQGEITEIKNKNERLVKENTELRSETRELKNNLDLLNKKGKQSMVVDSILNNINKDNFISFLSAIYKKDFSEKWNPEDTPLWLGVLTEYYSHKKEIIEMFKSFKINIPDNISTFRLPIDWNEDELDIFFDTMSNHYNCNGRHFDWNLGYWGRSSLQTVKEQCSHTYSEIPWQFILRNPLLKSQKYLEKIGRCLVKQYESNGSCFASITRYQSLTDEEIKIILNNIDYLGLKELKYSVGDFILKYVHLIDNDAFLSKVYKFTKVKYGAFDYIKNMNAKYIKKYFMENKDVSLDDICKCDKLSDTEKQEIMTTILLSKGMENKI